MLYRDYKIFRPGNYYHVFNRGVNKQIIFFDDEDYLQFLKRLKIILGVLPTSSTKTRIKPLPLESFSILSYCLMTNHFHLFIRQNTEISIDKLILKLCTSYSKYINKKYNRVGTLFQDNFKAKLIENDQYATYVSAYIHNNPQSPRTYQYSSYREILGLTEDNLCDEKILLDWFDNSAKNYEQFVNNFKKSNINLEFSF